MPRHIVHVLSDDTEFDTVYLQHLKEEGFDIFYETFTGDVKNFNWTIRHLSDDFEQGQKYAIIAFGEAATHALSAAQQTSLPHCVSLICYYPTAVPTPTHKYPASLDILCHLASVQPFGTATFKTDVYPDVYPGFAESDLEEYDKFAAGLSWGRTLACLRTGFGIVVDLEEVVDKYNAYKFEAATSTPTPNKMHHVNHVPTMTGGIGRVELDRFYNDVFKSNNPPSLKRRLLSRTVGADKVVDEMMISFRHTQEMPWILPGVPPTNKSVEVPVVSIVGIRGGRLLSEQMYWDQASVLVQIGLLDPDIVPVDMRRNGLQRLPVTGKEAAEKVLNAESHPSNGLISARR